MPRLVPYSEAVKTAGTLIKGDEPGALLQRHKQRQEMERQMERMREQFPTMERLPRLEPIPGTYGMIGREKKAQAIRAAAAADAGRKLAHAQVNTELAKLAGKILADQVGSDEEFEKVATLMVQTGVLSEEQFLLEKEAAWAGLRNLFTKARGALSGARGKIGGWFSKLRKPATSAAAAPAAKAGWSAGKKGFGWGKALPWLAAGGAIYAGSKLIPAAARALESTSTTPMAHGLGWSPVDYGYGSTPYGPGMATMGGGA